MRDFVVVGLDGDATKRRQQRRHCLARQDADVVAARREHRRQAAKLNDVAEALFGDEHQALSRERRAVPARLRQRLEGRLASLGAEFVIGKAGRPVAAQEIEPAAAEMRLGQLRIALERRLVGRHRRIEARRGVKPGGGVEMGEILERVAAVDMGFRDVGATLNRLVEARQRLGVAAEPLKQRAAVEPVGRRGRVERQRPVEALQRLVGKAGIEQDIGAVAVRVGEVGVDGDGAVETLDRLQPVALAVQRLAEQIVHTRLRRPVGDGAAGELDALLELALLAGDHGDVIERIGIVRVDAQHLDVAFHGLRQIALAVVEQALLEQLRGCGGFGHEGVLSRDRRRCQAAMTAARASWYAFCSEGRWKCAKGRGS